MSVQSHVSSKVNNIFSLCCASLRSVRFDSVQAYDDGVWCEKMHTVSVWNKYEKERHSVVRCTAQQVRILLPPLLHFQRSVCSNKSDVNFELLQWMMHVSVINNTWFKINNTNSIESIGTTCASHFDLVFVSL